VAKAKAKAKVRAPRLKKKAKAKKPEREPGVSVVLGPSTPKTHDGRGRFKVGNPGGPGNPIFRELHRSREALATAIRSFDPVHVFEVMKSMFIEATRRGNTQAARVFLEYAVGKPAVTLMLKSEGGPMAQLMEYVQKGVPDKELIKAVQAEDVTVEKSSGRKGT